MASVNTLWGYKQLLNTLDSWKYHLRIYYHKKRFKFNNINLAGSSATLRIFGVVPEFKPIVVATSELGNILSVPDNSLKKRAYIVDQYNEAKAQGLTEVNIGFSIPSKEYLIYSETKSTRLDSWEIIIPSINSADFNVMDVRYQPASWAKYAYSFPIVLNPVLKYITNYNITEEYVETLGYPNKFYLPTGVQYTNSNAATNQVRFNSRVIPDETPGYGITQLINADINNMLSDINVIHRIYQETGEHPAIKFYAETEDPNRTKFYDTVPIGVESYVVEIETSNGNKTRKSIPAADMLKFTI